MVAGLARLLTFAAAGVAVSLLGVNPASWALRYPRRAEVFHGILGDFLNPWAHWDGVWFIKIAVNGYASNDGSVAFFPLFPLLLRWVGVAFNNNLVIAGIVFSLACYVGAMVLLYRLVEAEFDQQDGVPVGLLHLALPDRLLLPGRLQRVAVPAAGAGLLHLVALRPLEARRSRRSGRHADAQHRA